MDHAFDLAAIGRIFAQGVGIVGAEDGGNIAFGIFLHAFRFDDVGVAQTHFFTQHQTLVLFVGFFAEVRAIDQISALNGTSRLPISGLFGWFGITTISLSPCG